ncbi:unnamed protein product, partial [Laminaria digitata]
AAASFGVRPLVPPERSAAAPGVLAEAPGGVAALGALAASGVSAAPGVVAAAPGESAIASGVSAAPGVLAAPGEAVPKAVVVVAPAVEDYGEDLLLEIEVDDVERDWSRPSASVDP